MTQYRITGTMDVDVTIEPLPGDEFSVAGIWGRTWMNREELAAIGLTVTEVIPPDPVGTIRRFTDSENRVVLTLDGWYYLAPVSGEHGWHTPSGKYRNEESNPDWRSFTEVVT